MTPHNDTFHPLDDHKPSEIEHSGQKMAPGRSAVDKNSAAGRTFRLQSRYVYVRLTSVERRSQSGCMGFTLDPRAIRPLL